MTTEPLASLLRDPPAGNTTKPPNSCPGSVPEFAESRQFQPELWDSVWSVVPESSSQACVIQL